MFLRPAGIAQLRLADNAASDTPTVPAYRERVGTRRLSLLTHWRQLMTIADTYPLSLKFQSAALPE